MISTASVCFPSKHQCLVRINLAGSRRLKVRGGINSVIFVPENENGSKESGPVSCQNFVLSKVKAVNILKFFPPFFVFLFLVPFSLFPEALRASEI